MMRYCEECHSAVEKESCPNCGAITREIEANDLCLLTEHDDMQAHMIMSVLDNNKIEHVDVPVRGSGLTMSSSSVEIYRIYVPYKNLIKAKELIKEN